jgi:hypothetical protein
VRELVEKPDTFVRSSNASAHPFVWTATAGSILTKRLCERISRTVPLVNLPEKVQIFLIAVALSALRQERSLDCIQRRKQGRGSVAQVIVSAPLAYPTLSATLARCDNESFPMTQAALYGRVGL